MSEMEVTTTKTADRIPRDPLDRFVTILVAVFASWTLYCQVLTFSNRNFHELLKFLPLFFLTLSVLLYGAWVRLFARLLTAPSSPCQISSYTSNRSPLPFGFTLLVNVAIVFLCSLNPRFEIFWFVALLWMLLQVASCASLTFTPPPLLNPVSTREFFLIGLLSLISLTLTLASHRPDPDDCNYVNLALGLIEHPTQPIFAFDTMHGISGAPIHQSVYRVHSYEILMAVVSRATGLSPLSVAHLVLPAFFALIFPWTLAWSLRSIAPENWQLGCVLTVAALLGLGHHHTAFGNFGFVRLFQGKAVLVTLAVPLICGAAWRWMTEPSLLRWFQFGGAQIFAVGLSSSGLFTAPLAAGMTLGAAVPFVPHRGNRLGLGGLTLLYPLGLGFALALTSSANVAARLHLAPLRNDLLYVSGLGLSGSLTWLAVIGASSLARSTPLKGKLAALGALFLLVPANPFLYDVFSSHVTGNQNWRLWWSFPVPMLLGLAGAEALGRISIPAWRSAFLLGLLMVAVLGPTSVLRQENGLRLGKPSLKVPEKSYALAQVVAKLVPRGYLVAAPQTISAWLPTIPGHPYPLVSRDNYVDAWLKQRKWITRRHLINLYVNGRRRTTEAQQYLEDDLRQETIGLIALREGNPWRSDIEQTARRHGFTPSPQGAMTFWLAPSLTPKGCKALPRPPVQKFR